ncbi:DUF4386 domain-containing protein [Flavobacterium crassostreae]|uniref:DUF4386 domain-containing protein n=1 Tax=Flavobacterium crassostreae TaxID=1763534 RepID=A0A1B9DXL5_9FLAO|nr:DUF4386 domain-containing protein [Flavobacterium crassostreae]OCB74419.1 hypothetical protein LPBF_10510 [Flavobacterium crassostreae]
MYTTSKKRYSPNKTAKIAGALILAGIVFGILSIAPSVDGTAFLTESYPDRIAVFRAAFFQFLLVPIYIGFAITLYQMAWTYNRSIAIAFVGFRLIAGVFQLLGVILLPICIHLSYQYLHTTDSNLALYQNIGELLKLFRDLCNHLGVMLATGLSNLLLHTVFIKKKSLPSKLLIWGIISNLLLLFGSFLILFQQIKVLSITYALLTIPIVVQEIVLAIWLLLKGFKTKATNT